MLTSVKAQPQQEGAHRPHEVGQGAHLECPAQMTGRLCHWAIPDTYYIKPLLKAQEMWQLYLIHRKKTQGGCQNEGTKKHGLNKRTDQNPRKRLKKMETSTLLPDAEFETLDIRMLSELRGRVDELRTSTA